MEVGKDINKYNPNALLLSRTLEGERRDPLPPPSLVHFPQTFLQQSIKQSNNQTHTHTHTHTHKQTRTHTTIHTHVRTYHPNVGTDKDAYFIIYAINAIVVIKNEHVLHPPLPFLGLFSSQWYYARRRRSCSCSRRGCRPAGRARLPRPVCLYVDFFDLTNVRVRVEVVVLFSSYTHFNTFYST